MCGHEGDSNKNMTALNEDYNNFVVESNRSDEHEVKQASRGERRSWGTLRKSE